MNKKTIVNLFFLCVTLVSATPNNRIVVNLGYTENSCKFIEFTEFNEIPKNMKPSRHAMMINAGMVMRYIETGVYYGAGSQIQFGQIGGLQRGGYEIPSATVVKHKFGVYSNLYLTSFFRNNKIFSNSLNVYATVKLGGYHVPDKNETNYKPYGAGVNCYAGLGSSYYFLEKIGVFGEIGYDYYPAFENYVSMSKMALRIGVSLGI